MFQAWPQLQTRQGAIPAELDTTMRRPSLTHLFREKKNPFCKSIRLKFHFNIFALDTSHFSFFSSSIVYLLFFLFCKKYVLGHFLFQPETMRFVGPKLHTKVILQVFFFFKLD